MKVFGIVYLIRNRVNGKVYVGQTTQTLHRRWKGHRCDAKTGVMRISRAITKYGEDSFDKVVLHQAFSKEELDEMERRAIFSHNSIDSEMGYNCETGGRRCGTISDATRKKLSLASLGKKKTAKHCANISRGLKGKPSAMRGVPKSLETRARMSAASMGKPGTTTGRKLHPEHIARLVAFNTGRPSPMRGTKQTPELIAKRVASRMATFETRGKNCKETRWQPM